MNHLTLQPVCVRRCVCAAALLLIDYPPEEGDEEEDVSDEEEEKEVFYDGPLIVQLNSVTRVAGIIPAVPSTSAAGGILGADNVSVECQVTAKLFSKMGYIKSHVCHWGEVRCCKIHVDSACVLSDSISAVYFDI